MRRILGAGITGATVFFSMTGPSAGAVPPDPEASDASAAPDSLLEAAITYVAGSSVYIDAGREAGLVEGVEGTVLRGGSPIATVTVTYLSARRAACTVMTAEATPEPGDKVRLPRAAALLDVGGGGAPPETAPPVLSSEAGWFRRFGLRGRLGLRYFTLQDRGAGGESYAQPAVDVNLQGSSLGGAPFDLSLDARQRRTTRTRVDGVKESEGRTRVYAAHGTWRPGANVRFTVGRQVSGRIPGVGTFDGVLASKSGKVGWGAFVGTQPDAVTHGLASDILEFGAYSELAPRGTGTGARPWSLTTGVVGSLAEGVSNREYMYLRGQVQGRRLAVTAGQEIDHYRGWRAEAEGKRWSATSTLFQGRYRVSPALSLRAGFDNRRRVRLDRDRETPETEFDDSYRQGVHAGGDVRFLGRFRADLSVRSSRGGSAGHADAGTLVLGAARLAAIDLTARHTRYRGPLVAGWLHAVEARARLFSSLDLAAHAGLRTEERRNASAVRESTRWFGVDVDLGLTRGWYAMLSLERVGGDAERTDQIYSSLTYRF